jgi:hypothetical protein
MDILRTVSHDQLACATGGDGNGLRFGGNGTSSSDACFATIAMRHSLVLKLFRRI